MPSANSNRILRAAIVSFLGTATLWCLGLLLDGLVGGTWDLIFCGAGAFISALMIPGGPKSYTSNLPPAVSIVFVTFAFISLGHAGEQVFERHAGVDFEPIGKFIWATIATSWWLIPCVAVVLRWLNEKFPPPEE